MRVVELLLVILGLHLRKPLDELHYEELLMKIKKKWKKVNLCIEAEEYYFQSFLQCKNIWGGGYSSYFPYPP